jgi:hypothetical protein
MQYNTKIEDPSRFSYNPKYPPEKNLKTTKLGKNENGIVYFPYRAMMIFI